MLEERISLDDDADVVAAWKAALKLGRGIGLGVFNQACLSAAVLELCRQVVERGGHGRCALADQSDGASLRARVVVEGCPAELLSGGKSRFSREINIGPSLPAVRLHQVAESLHAEPAGDGCRLTMTIQQSRAARPAPRRPSAAVPERRR